MELLTLQSVSENQESFQLLVSLSVELQNRAVTLQHLLRELLQVELEESSLGARGKKQPRKRETEEAASAKAIGSTAPPLVLQFNLWLQLNLNLKSKLMSHLHHRL